MKQIDKLDEPYQAQKVANYQPPAIIYEGTISTRAGSPIGPRPGGDDQAIDPVDLFGDDEG
ncbi:MAG: hypothetical protein KJ063_01665 [Anaerolineae bacterium]|nr:hypothetical protein [Anaerolineae bacterium]